jgi:iron complex outermembrane receptor protein
VEVDARAYPIDPVYLWANYAFTDATFEKLNTTVPLVPEHQVSFGFEWQVVEPLLFSMTGRYVGSRFDGNDFSNDRFKKLDSYTTFDSKVSYTYKKLNLFAGINNILDERYSTVAFSESYFTMPTRNYYAGLELRL